MIPTSSAVLLQPNLTPEHIGKASRYLVVTRDALAESAAGLSASQWDFKPAPDRWSIAEIIEHVVLVEQRVHGVVGMMSEAPEAAPGHEQTEMDETILREIPNRSTRFKTPERVTPTHRWSGREALAVFLEGREQTIQLLSAPSLRGRVVPHPIFGPWDGYQWILGAGAHSSRHIEQIREVKADPHFPKD